MHDTSTPAGPHVHHHYMNTGGSYGSNPLEAHVGVGKATSIDQIVVWWQRTGVRQVIPGPIAIGSTVRITEGQQEIEHLTLPTFSYDVSQLGQSSGEPATCH